mmetsp:Transcript_86635/g.245192  ORF Transcript_86635/g.245192 Transcript_86635/m.245192 type:complete len:240 (+) Transcript_86635:166-885(+)
MLLRRRPITPFDVLLYRHKYSFTLSLFPPTHRVPFQPIPPLEEHPHWPLIEGDKRYDGIDCPKGESLEDTQKRVVEYWNSDILPEICRDDGDPDDCVLVVAHANTLRALVMHLDNISAAEIEDVNVPTAIPFYYEIDKDTGAALRGVGGTGKAGDSAAFTGQYLYDERKKVNFLERRRAASDPWGWALVRDHTLPSPQAGLRHSEAFRLNTSNGRLRLPTFSPSHHAGTLVALHRGTTP